MSTPSWRAQDVPARRAVASPASPLSRLARQGGSRRRAPHAGDRHPLGRYHSGCPAGRGSGIQSHQAQPAAVRLQLREQGLGVTTPPRGRYPAAPRPSSRTGLSHTSLQAHGGGLSEQGPAQRHHIRPRQWGSSLDPDAGPRSRSCARAHPDAAAAPCSGKSHVLPIPALPSLAQASSAGLVGRHRTGSQTPLLRRLALWTKSGDTPRNGGQDEVRARLPAVLASVHTARVEAQARIGEREAM